MFSQDWSEIAINIKEFLLKNLFDLLSFGLEDFSSPHSNNFPSFEIFKEVLLRYLTKVASIDQPVLQGDKFDGLIVLVQRKTLLGEGIVAVGLLLRTQRISLEVYYEIV